LNNYISINYTVYTLPFKNSLNGSKVIVKNIYIVTKKLFVKQMPPFMTFNDFSKTFSQRHNHIAMMVLKRATRKSKCQGGQKTSKVNLGCTTSKPFMQSRCSPKKKKKIRSLQSR